MEHLRAAAHRDVRALTQAVPGSARWAIIKGWIRYPLIIVWIPYFETVPISGTQGERREISIDWIPHSLNVEWLATVSFWLLIEWINISNSYFFGGEPIKMRHLQSCFTFLPKGLVVRYFYYYSKIYTYKLSFQINAFPAGLIDENEDLMSGEERGTESNPLTTFLKPAQDWPLIFDYRFWPFYNPSHVLPIIWCIFLHDLSTLHHVFLALFQD